MTIKKGKREWGRVRKVSDATGQVAMGEGGGKVRPSLGWVEVFYNKIFKYSRMVGEGRGGGGWVVVQKGYRSMRAGMYPSISIKPN